MRKSKKQRGRPVGFRLSEMSKRAISLAKTGQKHKQSTKDKISKSLIIYFRNLHPLSEEIVKKYGNIENTDLYRWINDRKEEIDCIDDVRTERSIKNANRIELAYGPYIEFFSHNLTPEQLMILKEDSEVCKDENAEFGVIRYCV